MSSTPERRIILWTAPRCVSTAFERAVLQRKDTRCFHEPFGDPYYYGPERVSTRYAEQPVQGGATFQAVLAQLMQHTNKRFVFSKDMAYYVSRFLDDASEDTIAAYLQPFHHTFLIRHPAKAIPSLYKASLDTAATGWDHFDAAEAGFKDLLTLCNRCAAVTPQPCIIIDADDLLDEPAAVLRAYCQAVGMPWDEGMLTWEPGPVQDFQTWPGWHDAVMNSNGLRARHRDSRQRKDDREKLASYKDSVEEVQRCIEECLPLYVALYRKRLMIPGIADNEMGDGDG